MNMYVMFTCTLYIFLNMRTYTLYIYITSSQSRSSKADPPRVACCLRRPLQVPGSDPLSASRTLGGSKETTRIAAVGLALAVGQLAWVLGGCSGFFWKFW